MRKVFQALVLLTVVLAFSVSNASASVPIFSDPFNSISGWTVSGSGSVTTSTSSSPATTSGKPYARLTVGGNESVSITRAISTLGFDNIGFSYYRATSSYERSDVLIAAWKLTSSPTWILLEDLRDDQSWTLKDFSLPGAANSSIDIGFYSENSSRFGTDYGLFDDALVYGEKIVEIPPVGTGPTTTPEPATMLLLGAGLVGALGFKKRS